MNYELANQLTDAGFPKHLCSTWSDISKNPIDEERSMKCPTLEELIEACGDVTVVLHRYASKLDFREEACVAMASGHECYASTLTEAVAMIYLALNKK